MAVTLNASTSNGLIQTADTTGNLNLQSNGTTIAALTSAGLAVTGALTVSTTLGVTGAVTSNGNFRSNPSRYTSLGLLSQTNLGGGWDGGLNVSDVNQVGLGFPNTYFPVALAAIQTSASGYGVADLVIATRAATTDTAPIERLRITGAGEVTIPGALVATGGIKSVVGSTVVPSGVATTLFSAATAVLGTTGAAQVWTNVVNTATYQGTATIIYDGTNYTLLNNAVGAGITLSLSGSNFQATQSSGSNKTINWRYLSYAS